MGVSSAQPQQLDEPENDDDTNNYNNNEENSLVQIWSNHNRGTNQTKHLTTVPGWHSYHTVTSKRMD